MYLYKQLNIKYVAGVQCRRDRFRMHRCIVCNYVRMERTQMPSFSPVRHRGNAPTINMLLSHKMNTQTLPVHDRGTHIHTVRVHSFASIFGLIFCVIGDGLSLATCAVTGAASHELNQRNCLLERRSWNCPLWWLAHMCANSPCLKMYPSPRR